MLVTLDGVVDIKQSCTSNKPRVTELVGQLVKESVEKVVEENKRVITAKSRLFNIRMGDAR